MMSGAMDDSELLGQLDFNIPWPNLRSSIMFAPRFSHMIFSAFIDYSHLLSEEISILNTGLGFPGDNLETLCRLRTQFLT